MNERRALHTMSIYTTETLDTFSVTLKPRTVKSMTVTYSFKATPNVIIFPLSAVVLLSVAALSIPVLDNCSFLNVCVVLENPSVADLLKYRIQFSIGIITASLVLPGLIKNNSVRYHYTHLFFIPLGIAIASFVLPLFL